MRRNKDSKPAAGPSTEKKGKPSRNPLKRGTGNRNTMMQLGSPSHSMTELADTSSTGPSQTTERAAAAETTNGRPGEVAAVATGATVVAAAGTASVPTVEVDPSSPQTNGSAHPPEQQEKPAESSSSPAEGAEESEKPPSAVDDITRAQQEAAAVR
jgi:hypothetical protein